MWNTSSVACEGQGSWDVSLFLSSVFATHCVAHRFIAGVEFGGTLWSGAGTGLLQYMVYACEQCLGTFDRVMKISKFALPYFCFNSGSSWNLTTGRIMVLEPHCDRNKIPFIPRLPQQRRFRNYQFVYRVFFR